MYSLCSLRAATADKVEYHLENFNDESEAENAMKEL